MKAAEALCTGCNRIFTRQGLSRHVSKTHRVRCRAVHAASQPQSFLRSSPYERVLPMLTPNPASQGYPDPTFGSAHLSGRDGTPSNLPGFPPFITTGDADDCKFAL
jgi:hypothetical protein